MNWHCSQRSQRDRQLPRLDEGQLPFASSLAHFSPWPLTVLPQWPASQPWLIAALVPLAAATDMAGAGGAGGARGAGFARASRAQCVPRWHPSGALMYSSLLAEECSRARFTGRLPVTLSSPNLKQARCCNPRKRDASAHGAGDQRRRAVPAGIAPHRSSRRLAPVAVRAQPALPGRHAGWRLAHAERRPALRRRTGPPTRLHGAAARAALGSMRGD
eukprot:scaffold65729_cov72-Phaeocystis_antarctica.AAC.1